jgi:hypothetical protein
MWILSIFRRSLPKYLTLEEASRELAKVWPISQREPEPEKKQVEGGVDTPSSPVATEASVGRDFAIRPSYPPQQEVRSILRELLLRGALTGYIETESGHMEQVPPEFWTEGSTIEVTEMHRVKGERVEYQLSGTVLISREQVTQLQNLAVEVTSKKETQSRNRGGAPTKYDGEAFLTEAFRILYENSPAPRTAADLRRRALDATPMWRPDIQVAHHPRIGRDQR